MLRATAGATIKGRKSLFFSPFCNRLLECQNTPYRNDDSSSSTSKRKFASKRIIFPQQETDQSRHRAYRNRSSSSSPSSSGQKRQQKQPQPQPRLRSHRLFGSVEEANKAIDNLLVRVSKLDNPKEGSLFPPEEEMLAIFNDTQSFFLVLANSVEEQTKLNPSGKHGKQLSKLLELVLFVYSQLHFLPNIALFDESQQVLDTLKSWNLNVRSGHYDYAIRIANNELRWKEASQMFWDEISPEAGYNPVEVSISNPHGLIAIAKYAQQQNSAVVDNVFDAVQQLSMVSPNDQRTYVLAAGTALGYVGEWEAAIQYLNTSSNSSRFGETLVASVMQTCLLCNRPIEALEIFDSNVINSSAGGSISREWQWGGESDRMDPLCRDLALRAVWSQPQPGDGRNFGTMSQYIQDIVSEGCPISIDALLGITLTCEQRLNPDLALHVLLSICDSKTTRTSFPERINIVSGDEMFLENIVEGGGVNESTTASVGDFDESWLPIIGKLLASTMRTCNTASRFGTSLFCLQLVSLHSGTALRKFDANDVPKAGNISPQHANLHDSILELSTKTNNLDELIKPTMVALCGLRCSHQAVEIFEDAIRENEDCLREEGKTLDMMYKFALSEEETVIHIGNPWMSAAKHIKILLDATRLCRQLDPEEKACFQNVLAAAMRACTAAHQPDLSLVILSWVEKALVSESSADAKRLSRGVGWMIPDDHQTVPKMASFEVMGDAVLAESISAHQWKKGDRIEAVQLFEDLLDTKSDELDQWRLSCTAGLSALIANGRGYDAYEIFKVLDPETLTTESYATVGQFLARSERWDDLANLYRSALENGHLSEELSLLAMKAVVSSKIDNRLRVLRSVVKDSANAVGLDPIGWMVSRYWIVKRAIGFNYARLLMWWNDPDTCHIRELDFAIQKFRQERQEGQRAKKDVVRAIIGTARNYHDILDYNKSLEGEWQHVPSSAEEWKLLLRQILEETRASTIRYDTSFVDDLVETCLMFGCTKECAIFVEDLLDTGDRLNRKSLAIALEAAKSENAHDLENDMLMLLSDSHSES